MAGNAESPDGDEWHQGAYNPKPAEELQGVKENRSSVAILIGIAIIQTFALEVRSADH